MRRAIKTPPYLASCCVPFRFEPPAHIVQDVWGFLLRIDAEKKGFIFSGCMYTDVRSGVALAETPNMA